MLKDLGKVISCFIPYSGKEGEQEQILLKNLVNLYIFSQIFKLHKCSWLDFRYFKIFQKILKKSEEKSWNAA